MTDLRLVYDPRQMTFDLALDGTSLALDRGLEAPVIMSLFCDRRADAADVDADERDQDRRGWCGDALPRVSAGEARKGRRLGSRLWLRQRLKQTQATLALIQGDCDEALAWMVDDGLAKSVEVDAWYPRTGLLAIRVIIDRPDGERVDYRWELLWQDQATRDGVIANAV